MKIAEKHAVEDGKIHVVETHDFNPVLDKAAQLRSAGLEDMGESKLVGLVPMALWTAWARKWGVSPQDSKAMKEVVARELMDRDNAQFRVWDGRF